VQTTVVDPAAEAARRVDEEKQAKAAADRLAEAEAKLMSVKRARAEAEAKAKQLADAAEKVKDEQAAQKKAEEHTSAKAAAETDDARKLAKGDRIRKFWQAGQLAGLLVQLDYGRDAADQQAGRALARLLRGLGGNVVLPGAPADIVARQQVVVRRSETIGKRRADVTITVECFVSVTNAPCADSAYVFRGAGDGPNFETAIERALREAIHALEGQLRSVDPASRP
jgi:hypothetical protein